jgi:8-oxo-dGTP pyrophosphatase MutT (NUDIX family)
MANKTKKAQVVLAAPDPESQTYFVLLLQTNERRGRFWQNVTGKLEKSETFEEGALREAMEETGLDQGSVVDLIDLNLTHEFVDQRSREVIERAFLLVLDGQWKVKLDPQEHEAFRWVELDGINRDSVMHLGNFEALERALRILRQRGV